MRIRYVGDKNQESFSVEAEPGKQITIKNAAIGDSSRPAMVAKDITVESLSIGRISSQASEEAQLEFARRARRAFDNPGLDQDEFHQLPEAKSAEIPSITPPTIQASSSASITSHLSASSSSVEKDDSEYRENFIKAGLDLIETAKRLGLVEGESLGSVKADQKKIPQQKRSNLLFLENYDKRRQQSNASSSSSSQIRKSK